MQMMISANSTVFGQVPVHRSHRHIHITEETCLRMFGDTELTVNRRLFQSKYFLAKERVHVYANGKVFTDVAILGPCRKYDQFEISMTDAVQCLPYRAPGNLVRNSGDLIGSPGFSIHLRDLSKEKRFNSGVIVAKSHIHLPQDSNEFDYCSLRVDGPRGESILSLRVCYGDDIDFPEVHVDDDVYNAVCIDANKVEVDVGWLLEE